MCLKIENKPHATAPRGTVNGQQCTPRTGLSRRPCLFLDTVYSKSVHGSRRPQGINFARVDLRYNYTGRTTRARSSLLWGAVFTV